VQLGFWKKFFSCGKICKKRGKTPKIGQKGKHCGTLRTLLLVTLLVMLMRTTLSFFIFHHIIHENYILFADARWMFSTFRIGFTITGRNFSAELQDIGSQEYKTAAAKIFAHVSSSVAIVG